MCNNPDPDTRLQLVSFLVCIILMCLVCVDGTLMAQTPREACALLNIDLLSPSQTRIHWDAPPNAEPAIVRVRYMGDVEWRLSQTVHGPPWFVDLSDTHSLEVEVQHRWIVSSVPILASGYVAIHRTVDVAAALQSERMLVIIDSEAYTALRTVLDRYVATLIDDGWVVDLAHIPPSASPPEVKSVVMDHLSPHGNRGKLTHLLLLGDVPYATSGGFSVEGAYPNPDFHKEHGGAWASDAYYADVETSPGVDAEYQWTDYSVSLSDPEFAQREQNRNEPNDGKFDNSMIPTDVELCVGRVDMRDLQAFGTSVTNRSRELELLRTYLERNVAYRTGTIMPPLRALIDDNFGLFSRVQQDVRITEAFAASAWRSFSPIVGTDNIVLGDWVPDNTQNRPTLTNYPALLSYACGGGGYEHCSYVATTTELATLPGYSVINFLFGSYFGDVASSNNIMRAVLAREGWSLTVGWSGRPHWFIHSLAAGATIGQAARLSANNGVDYVGATYIDQASGQGGIYPLGHRGIHVMLLGDPTIRLQGPIMNGDLFLSRQSGTTLTLQWNPAIVHEGKGLDDVAYIIEVGDASDLFRTVLVTADTSAVIPYPAESLVRVRPLYTAIRRPSPLPGHGITAPVPIGITSVREHDESVSYLYFDLLGRLVGQTDSLLPHGLWLAQPTDGKGLGHLVWK